MKLVIRPAAAGDLESAFLWYERQRIGLGDAFLAADFRTYPEVVVILACMHGRRDPALWRARA